MHRPHELTARLHDLTRMLVDGAVTTDVAARFLADTEAEYASELEEALRGASRVPPLPSVETSGYPVAVGTSIFAREPVGKPAKVRGG